MVAPPGRPRLWTRGDVAAAALIFSGTAAYLAALPRGLGHSDETTYLYEALRILRGDVLYADLFEIITPGWMYLMAAVFWLFGPGIDTARLTAAALHGASAALLYAAARQLGARRAFACLPALAYLVVAQPAWQIASQHWFGTLLCILLFLACAAARRGGARSALCAGLLVGALIGVQQARGVFTGAGMIVWLAADELLRRRFGGAGAPLFTRLALLFAGAALVVAPLLAFMIATAGFEPVWRGLVIHPIFNYGVQGQPPWGSVNALTRWDATFTFPRLLRLLPCILPICAARLAWHWLRRGDAATAHALALLIVFCLTAMASIAYFPDFIHIAFISPFFFLAIAECIESAARRLAPHSAGAASAVWATTAVLLLLGAARLHDNRERLREHFRFRRDTAFGRIDFAKPAEVQIYDELQRRLAAEPRRELYTYPGFLNLYLTLNARNPTRYQFFLPGYSSADQVQSVIADLAASPPPYIVVAAPALLRDDDPVWAFIRGAYAPLQDAGEAGRAIYRRIAPAPSAGAAPEPLSEPRSGALP